MTRYDKQSAVGIAFCNCQQFIGECLSRQDARFTMKSMCSCLLIYSTPEEEYYFRRGNEAQDKGNWKEAVDYFTKAVETNDRNANNLYHLAYCLQEVWWGLPYLLLQVPVDSSIVYERASCDRFLFVSLLFCRLRQSLEEMSRTTKPNFIIVRCLPSIRYITRPGTTSATCKKSWRSSRRPLSVSTKRLR